MNKKDFLDDEEIEESYSIKCSCGYTWETKSKLIYVTCPSCRLKCYNKEVDKRK